MISQRISDQQLRLLITVGIVFLLGVKLFLASRLDLYSDEVFYWLASTRPAIAYSDLPFMTALLVGLGSLVESSPLGVRSLFLMMGSCLPVLVYWLARPISNRRQALESSLLTLCLPMGGFMGLLAVPDVPLIFFGLLALGFFERALRLDRLVYWLGTGVFVAFGLSTHYRYFLYPLGALLFLLYFQAGRRQWKNPKLWLAGLVAASGLAPIVWFNLQNQLASASFYLVDRHPWEFDVNGLLHIFEQAFVVTPLLYLLLGFTLWRLLKTRHRIESGPVLLTCVALSNGLVYLILAPWTDADSTSIHWPLSAYFPLLVLAPEAARDLHKLLAKRWSELTSCRLLKAIPPLGFLGTLIALTGIGSQAFQSELQPLLGKGVLSNKMAGWQDFSEHTAKLLDTHFPNQRPTLITDNYYTAGQVALAGLSDNPLTLDEDKAVRDGRIAQLRLWRMNELGLEEKAGSPVLYITEDSTLNAEEKFNALHKMCLYAADLVYLDSLDLFNGEKRFSYYRSSAIADSASLIGRAKPCPYPPFAWLETPTAGDTLTARVRLSGWAYQEDIGIESAAMLIDGNHFTELNYGVPRADVVAAMGVNTDPNAPALGFVLEFDSAAIENGDHVLELELTDTFGMKTRYGAREITVQN